ncbi:glycoside hydrolase family 2 TIM barrel-domain containing protein [Tamlana sp. I1]|uniref:glycoside hydrolase family 2 TIM barrel-domain containing protein n=1 Tax=Tamlana sp. I1 TaxID=2762061 RepID=UPI0018906727|nr:glycoside hydrolase family 2 TIM barrel-domain containing protein [Tamlana sp. I1]
MKNIILIVFIILTFISCKYQSEKVENGSQSSKVEVKSVNGQSHFYVNDSLFQLKGIGFNFEYNSNLESLKKTGANAIRTWSTKYADTILKAARKQGVMVALGISMGKELWGFNYEDSLAVANQFEKVKSIVETYKSHPNLLCWVVGNELNLLFEADGETLKTVNPKVYDAISDIVDYIHETDINHPVTMTFAGVIPEHLQTALERVPQLDIVSVQVYADLENVEARMKEVDVEKPYMITEFGPKGFWEMPKTEWNREIEEASGPKADGIKHRMKVGLANNTSGKCLGGFAFVWGQKHERTPTWYGMHHADGKQTEYIDILTKLWTGNYPENRAPRVDSLLLNSLHAVDNVYLKPNTEYTAQVFASDPNKDTLNYSWEVAQEVDKRSQGGEKEVQPPRIAVKIVSSEEGYFTFITPKETGAYRILSYVYDSKNKAGNANIPFYIKN